MKIFCKTQLYYLLLFEDEEFMKPIITTLKLLNIDRDQHKWIFADYNSCNNNEFSEVKKFSIDKGSIDAVYSIQDLIVELANNLGHGNISRTHKIIKEIASGID